jgi:hypothetical protein
MQAQQLDMLVYVEPFARAPILRASTMTTMPISISVLINAQILGSSLELAIESD